MRGDAADLLDIKFADARAAVSTVSWRRCPSRYNTSSILGLAVVSKGTKDEVERAKELHAYQSSTLASR